MTSSPLCRKRFLELYAHNACSPRITLHNVKAQVGPNKKREAHRAVFNNPSVPLHSKGTLVLVMSSPTHEFECACKKVKAYVTGDPMLQGYCHCVNCRDWYQSTPLSFAVYPWDSVKITQGSDNLTQVSLVNPDLERLFCKTCGYRVNTQSAQFKVKIVPKSNLDGLDFKPVGHNYCKYASKESLTQFKGDGLPKWRGAPPAFGGPDDQIDL